jgi:hypothetical protein
MSILLLFIILRQISGEAFTIVILLVGLFYFRWFYMVCRVAVKPLAGLQKGHY